MARKIYFLGGLLDAEEREKIFHNKFERQIRDSLARDFEGIDYEFVVDDQCTRAEFQRIWRAPDTYGIVWFGHGRPDGRPATSEASNGTIALNPMTLGQSSANLHFLALLSCMSDGYADEWRRKMANRDAPVKTFHGTILANMGILAGTLERWLGSRRTWMASATTNLSAMLRAAAKIIKRREVTSGELLPQQRISADHFEPIRVFVPTIIIPRVGQGGGGRTGVTAPKPEPKPPGSAGVPWQFQNRSGRWQVTPGAGRTGPLGGRRPLGAGAGAGTGIALSATRAAEIARRDREARELREAQERARREADERAARERRQREAERQRLEAARRQLQREQALAGTRIGTRADPYRFWGLPKPQPKPPFTTVELVLGAGPMRQHFPGEPWRTLKPITPVTVRFPIGR